MIPIWIGKMIATRVIKAVKHKIDLNKIDKYVNKPNELDIQMKMAYKSLQKYGKRQEEVEKEVAILRKDSHPPVFAAKDYKKILRRLNKLEKKEK